MLSREQWWFLLIAGFIGGLTHSYIKCKDILGYVINCLVGAFTSLFFGSTVAIWTHDYFQLTIPYSEYLSGCGFIIGLLAMEISSYILNTINKRLNDEFDQFNKD